MEFCYLLWSKCTFIGLLFCSISSGVLVCTYMKTVTNVSILPFDSFASECSLILVYWAYSVSFLPIISIPVQRNLNLYFLFQNSSREMWLFHMCVEAEQAHAVVIGNKSHKWIYSNRNINGPNEFSQVWILKPA